MSSFPNLTDGLPFRQTIRRTLSMRTEVLRTLDMKEQRYVDRTPTYRFEAQYGEISAADYTTLQSFHDTMQGRFGQFDVTFDGTLYSNVYFDQDRIDFKENSLNNYATSIKLKGFPDQAFPSISGLVDPTLPTLARLSVFPYDFAHGPLTQWPSSLGHIQSNVIVDLDDTARFAYHRLNTAIPCGVLQMPVITELEASIFEQFFLVMGGRYGAFRLIYNSVNMVCRFDTDEMVIEYPSPNVCSITLPWCSPPV